MSQRRWCFFCAIIIASILILVLALIFQFLNYDYNKLPIYQHELLLITLKCNIIKKVFAI